MLNPLPSRTYWSGSVLGVFIALVLTPVSLCHASIKVAEKGKTDFVIVRQANATPAEQTAARELSNTLHAITGANFVVSDATNDLPKETILIGPGSVTAKLFPEIPFDKLGPDEIVIKTKGKTLLLAGGRPRGTMYAVNRFLQEQCGVRWWTAWATNIPHSPTLKIKDLNIRYAPPFEYRAPFWQPAFNPAWKAHNEANDENSTIPAELGGSVKYKGFAHTFHRLVPPEKHFAEHPEWYSLVKGKRTDHGQLCLTNPDLRDFVVKRVKEWLRESPDAQIVSVTQNDWNGWCECPNCKALDDAEGSHAGTMLTFANYIAEKIEPEFPNVLVDTFAYQYTRTPLKTVKARHNVTVRLCSIECNFREPLDHPSNASFANDIKKWSQICSHLYIWDYVTDFSAYIFPHPNWFTIGPNIRFFQRYGVRGIFEEGAYAGPGSEMAEMRAWVLAQMMWNPAQDDRALTKEFLSGYFGDKAGPLIYQYLDLVYNEAKGTFVACYLRKDPPPYLHFRTLAASEKLWQRAEQASQNDPEKLLRVRLAHLPVRFAFLKNWQQLRYDCWEQNATWPLPDSRKAVAEEFRTVSHGVAGKDWTHVNVLNEHGSTIDEFLKEHGDDVPSPGTPPPPRKSKAAAPRDIEIHGQRSIDLQDNVASLADPGTLAEIRPDDAASDLRAVWMPGDHHEWAFRISGAALPKEAQHGKWKIYAAVRVAAKNEVAPEAIAFEAGVYDNVTKEHPAILKAKARDVSDHYRSYLVGTAEMNPNRDIWVAPAGTTGISSVWVDRVFLVAE